MSYKHHVWLLKVIDVCHSIRIALPRHRLHGCACTSPLAHFYLHHADSSIRELHPFTTITHLASENRITSPDQNDLQIQFLFRKRGQINQAPQKPSKDGFATTVLNIISPPSRRRRKSQWTDQLAELAHNDTLRATSSSILLIEPPSRRASTAAFAAFPPNPTMPIQLRLEGPYFTPSDLVKYNTVVCLVAGIGISGAIAIAADFREDSRLLSTSDYICEDCGRQGHKPNIELSGNVWKKCIAVWSVKEDIFVELPFLKAGEGLEVVVKLTGEGRPRVDVLAMLRGVCKENPGSVWVCISGPDAFIAVAEEACKMVSAVEYYGARW